MISSRLPLHGPDLGQARRARGEVLFFSRGRGRGHAIPDLAIAEDLLRADPSIALTFVSYSVGARTVREFGHPVIDLDLPENNPFIETLHRSARLIAERRPALVISHEEFAALPAARLCGIPSVFITDWFVANRVLLTECMTCADEVLFLDEPAIYEEPAPLRGRVRYIGQVLRTFTASKADRASIRRELDLPLDATIILVLPGGSTLSSEQHSPIFPLLRATRDLLPCRDARLLWIATREDQDRIARDGVVPAGVMFREPHATIDRTMVASDVAVTKATRKTGFELNALGIPSISLSYGLNPVDEHRIPLIPTNTHLPVGGLTPNALCDHIMRALEAGRTMAPRPRVAVAAGRVEAVNALLEQLRRSATTPTREQALTDVVRGARIARVGG